MVNTEAVLAFTIIRRRIASQEGAGLNLFSAAIGGGCGAGHCAHHSAASGGLPQDRTGGRHGERILGAQAGVDVRVVVNLPGDGASRDTRTHHGSLELVTYPSEPTSRTYIYGRGGGGREGHSKYHNKT